MRGIADVDSLCDLTELKLNREIATFDWSCRKSKTDAGEDPPFEARIQIKGVHKSEEMTWGVLSVNPESLRKNLDQLIMGIEDDIMRNHSHLL